MNSPALPRRSFLKIGGTACAALLTGAPTILGQDKAGTKTPVLGTGAHRYEAIHDWGELPADIAYGNTHGVAEDSQGRIYIKHTVHRTSQKPDAVVVFDPNGKFITSWGAAFKGGAHGLHLAREGGQEVFYLCDTARRRIVKTTLTGEVIWERLCPEETGGYKTAQEYIPTNIATAPDGTVFVADGYGRNYIHIYRPDGTHVRTFGGTGKTPGHMRTPHGIMVDTRGPQPLLVVADRGNARLQYFTLAGEHVKFVTEELREPCHFDQRGDLLLIPDLKSRVTLFDRENRLVAHLGDGEDYRGIRDKDRTAFTPGKFVAPHGAIFDSQGNIFVVEWVEVGRVTKLRKVS